MAYNLIKEKLGGVHHFIEDGTTYTDNGTSLTVGASVRPNTIIPEMNSFGCAVDVQFDKDEESDEVTCFNPLTKSYEKETDTYVVADYIDIQTRDHSEPIYRMIFGVDGKIPTDGSEVDIYKEGERVLVGWVAVEGVSARSKSQRVNMWLRVKVMLKEYPGWSNEVTLPTLRYQKLASALNKAKFATDV